MKIAFLGNGMSIHIIKWANSFSKIKGFDVSILSQDGFDKSLEDSVKKIALPFSGTKGYFLNSLFINGALRKIKPDVVNVHYATGYGLISSFINEYPTVLNVWGADVYDVPYKSKLHFKLVERNLNKATLIASTSHCMAKHTQELFSLQQSLDITPFGVDIEKFKPHKFSRDNSDIVIGTVKTLHEKYGIDNLIKAVAILLNKGVCLSVRIVGGGPERSALVKLAEDLGVAEHIEFCGKIDNDNVPKMLSSFDVFVATSRLDSESFGVAVVEASSCGLPVVVSDVGGLPEVVVNNVTGIVVEKDDPSQLADALLRLADNELLRKSMGEEGRKRVQVEYDWNNCISRMNGIYKKVIK